MSWSKPNQKQIIKQAQYRKWKGELFFKQEKIYQGEKNVLIE